MLELLCDVAKFIQMPGDRRQRRDQNRVVAPNNRKWPEFAGGVPHIGDGAFGREVAALLGAGCASTAQREGPGGAAFDVGVGLHACGGLSDAILDRTTRLRSGFVDFEGLYAGFDRLAAGDAVRQILRPHGKANA